MVDSFMIHMYHVTRNKGVKAWQTVLPIFQDHGFSSLLSLMQERKASVSALPTQTDRGSCHLTQVTKSFDWSLKETSDY